jgi:hypothetical protein
MPRLESEWLDSQTWSLLALDATSGLHGRDPAAYSGLQTLEAENRVTQVPFRGQMIRGFAKVTIGPDAFWSEGVAGHVLASRVVGRPDRFLGDLLTARNQNGTLFHIIGSQGATSWQFDLRVPAIDGTVWTAWAMPEVNFNPFRTDETPRRVSGSALPRSLIDRRIRWTEGVVAYLEKRIEQLSPLEDRIREIERKMEELRHELDRLKH